VIKLISKHWIIYFIGLVLLFFVGHRLIFIKKTNFFDSCISSLLYPVLVVQKKIVDPMQVFFERKKTQRELENSIKQLRADKKALLAEVIELHATAQYIRVTQELVDFKKQYNLEGQGCCAQVLIKQCTDQEHFFLVDKGSYNNVALDMVAVYKNCLIGRVTQLFPYYSKVTLITDRSCKVPAYCQQTAAKGIHEGMHNHEATALHFVSHLDALQEGDLLLSSGQGLVFPQGFALGTIKQFNIAGLYYNVVVEPLLDIKNLDYCYLLQKGK